MILKAEDFFPDLVIKKNYDYTFKKILMVLFGRKTEKSLRLLETEK